VSKFILYLSLIILVIERVTQRGLKYKSLYIYILITFLFLDCTSEKFLSLQFNTFGPTTQVVIDRERGHALVFFDQISCAQAAVKEMRGVTVRGRRLQIDFASRECQETFYEHLERQGNTSEKPWDSRPSPASSFDITYVHFLCINAFLMAKNILI